MVVGGLILLIVGGIVTKSFLYTSRGLSFIGLMLVLIGVAMMKLPFDERERKSKEEALKRNIEERVRMEEEAREKVREELERKKRWNR